MKKLRAIFYLLFLCLFILVFFFTVKKRINNYFYTWLVNWVREEKLFKEEKLLNDNKKVIFLAIDDGFVFENMWPPDRKVWADLIGILSGMKAKAVVFDVLFLDATKSDEKFAQAMKKMPVFLASMFEERIILDNGKIRKKYFYREPVKILASNAAGIGFTNIFSNLRTVNKLFLIRDNKKFLPYEVYLKLKGKKEISKENIILSFFNIDDIYYIPLSEFLNNPTKWKKYIEDNVVFVGSATTLASDFYDTPIGMIPGCNVLIEVYNELNNKSFLIYNSKVFYIFLIMLLLLDTIVFIIFQSQIKSFFADLIAKGVFLSLLFLLIKKLFLKGIYSDFGFIIFLTLFSMLFSFVRFLAELVMVYRENLEKEQQYMKELYDLTMQVSNMDNIDEILSKFLQNLVSNLKLQRASILLWDGKQGVLKLRKVWPEFEIKNTNEFKVGEGVAGKVFKEKKPYILNNKEELKEYFKDFDSSKNIFNIACFPLLVNKRCIGVVNAVNKVDGFSKDDVQKVNLLINNIAGIIENARLYELATKDGLTNLYVRRYFDIRIKEEFIRARRYNTDLSLIMTDIDHFKSINDTYGHQTGDRVLAKIANLILKCVRKIDIPCRYGGEEFAIILPETGLSGAYKLAQRIRKEVEEANIEGLGVTVSVGVGSFKNYLKEPNQLIKGVDEALYRAKENGRNRVEVASYE